MGDSVSTDAGSAACFMNDFPSADVPTEALGYVEAKGSPSVPPTRALRLSPCHEILTHARTHTPCAFRQ